MLKLVRLPQRKSTKDSRSTEEGDREDDECLLESCQEGRVHKHVLYAASVKIVPARDAPFLSVVVPDCPLEEGSSYIFSRSPRRGHLARGWENETAWERERAKNCC